MKIIYMLGVDRKQRVVLAPTQEIATMRREENKTTNKDDLKEVTHASAEEEDHIKSFKELGRNYVIF